MWEVNNLGSRNGTEDEDSDGDGAGNAAEHTARTHPAQPASHFVITGITHAPNGNVTITWPTHAGLSYRIRYADSLASWTTLNPVLTGTGGTITRSDDGFETGSPPASEPGRFYQVSTGR